jgi:hypothetical protein
MGRRIYCNNDFVWKYIFGKQGSELCRLMEDYGVGKHNMDENGPQFTMVWDDINKLRDLLNETVILPNGREATRNQMLRNFGRAERRVFGVKGTATFDKCDKFYGRTSITGFTTNGRMETNYGSDTLFWSMAKAIYKTARKEYFKGNHTVVFQDEW